MHVPSGWICCSTPVLHNKTQSQSEWQEAEGLHEGVREKACLIVTPRKRQHEVMAN